MGGAKGLGYNFFFKLFLEVKGWVQVFFLGGLWGEYMSPFSILDDWGWVLKSIFLWIVGARRIKFKFFEFLGGGA
jgi:hypothetical protein